MTAQEKEDAFEPSSAGDPIDTILADHVRQSDMCDRLAMLADAADVAAVTAESEYLLTMLTVELRRHTADEEADLFPLLRRRCQPEDGIDRILRELSAEHELDQDLVDFIVADLKRLGAGGLANPVRLLINMRAYADTQRRHIAWENNVVIPIARKRLTSADLTTLRKAMAGRR